MGNETGSLSENKNGSSPEKAINRIYLKNFCTIKILK
jgi:hypothetical protein